MRKRDLKIFLLSFALSALFFGSTGAVVVWAHNGWSAPRAATATATPTSDTTANEIPTATPPGPRSTPQPTPVVGVTQVPIQNFAFTPAAIQVPVGTTVTWTNDDRAPHTVTFENGMADSGMLKPGDSFKYTFGSAGTFVYICAYHPGMVATVIVTA
jgi:plastocyanin